MPTMTNVERHEMTAIERLLADYDRYGVLPKVGGGDHEEGEGEGDGQNESTEKTRVEFSAEQQAEINRIVAKEVKDAKRKAREDRDAELQREKAQADAEAQRQQQEAAGEFEAVKASLTEERDAATSRLSQIEGEYEAISGYFTQQYEAALEELPDFITAFKPADDATFSQKAEWLSKAQEQARKVDAHKVRGNGPDPKPGAGKINERESKAQARSRVRPI